jgi:hypothetical protein
MISTTIALKTSQQKDTLLLNSPLYLATIKQTTTKINGNSFSLFVLTASGSYYPVVLLVNISNLLQVAAQA